MGFFSKISAGLKKTRDSIMGSVNSMLHAFTKIDEELFEELEEILIMGDVGAATAGRIREELRAGKPVQRATASKIARGSMVRWMAENGIERPEDLVRFDIGYAYAPELSSEDGRTLVFMKRA